MFGKLSLVDKSNHRKSTAGTKKVYSYDLSYSVKTAKFSITESAADRLDIQNNGMTLFVDDESGKAFFGLTSPENSVFLKGRAGSKKARVFKSDVTREKLNGAGIVANRFKLVELSESFTLGEVTYKMVEIVPVVLDEKEEAEAQAEDAMAEAEENEAAVTEAAESDLSLI